MAKLAACEPCRAAKIACDHGEPTCMRCRDADRAGECKYRDAPFKKRKRRKVVAYSTNAEGSHRPCSGPKLDMSVEGIVSKPHKYPNPGWLGNFSYTTLFDHLPSVDAASSTASPHGEVDQRALLENRNIVSQATVAHGAKVVEQIHCFLSHPSRHAIIQSWIAKNTNFALASVFVEPCATTVRLLLSNGPVNAVEVATQLFANSYRPLDAAPTNTPEEYSSQFCQQNARWETMGLFCTALSRAATDLAYTEACCETDQDRRSVQRLAMHFSDVCLDIAVSLDCLNDLQLFLQYENFILHSMVDGDQSFHSWKRLGDMTSSLFALGYHQQSEQKPGIPAFLTDLTRAAFARTYSADKNISIFLGRPPRIHRKYCRFYLPGHNHKISGRAPLQLHQWEADVAYDYLFETQWTALCALLKEDILDIFDAVDLPERDQRAEAIQQHALAQWSALPKKFRLEGPLKSYHADPSMLDFLVSARLNHLHILFLLRLALARSKPQFDTELVSISTDMMGIVIEAIVLKDQLSNSGTSLVWKVAYYGLAAAGVICLWLLGQPPDSQNCAISRSRIIQHLSVLVMQLEAGTLVQTEDSNYRVLMGASQTIGNLLDRLLNGGVAPQVSSTLYESTEGVESQAGWNAWDGVTLQDFETDFWLNLAEHPFLLGTDGVN